MVNLTKSIATSQEDFNEIYNADLGLKLLDKNNVFTVRDCNGNVISLHDGKRKAFLGKAPSLKTLEIAYNNKNASSDWLYIQIEELNAYCGGTMPMNIVQMRTLAEVIAKEYSYFKVSEMLYFFAMFKLSKFGKIYGPVIPMHITTALCQFKQYRADTLDRYRQQQTASDIGIKTICI